MIRVAAFLIAAALQSNLLQAAANTDYTNYNAGSEVRIRLQPAMSATAAIRYAGEQTPLVANIPLAGSEYSPLWAIPWDARTGRYEVDLTPSGGATIRNATSFAVHRQLAKVLSVELDKTFYTFGDTVNARILVRNVSNHPLNNLQVEFEPYNYPWVAPAPDEPKLWKHIVATSLTLAPGAEKAFDVQKATVIETEKEPWIDYYCVVIRDSRDPDRIYDLAFAPPAFATAPNTPYPKEYPFLYLYWRLSNVPRSEAYRHFYPPQFVSSVIDFNTSHTMFPTGVAPSISFSVHLPENSPRRQLLLRVLNQRGEEIQSEKLSGPIAGEHHISLRSVPAGLYTAEISVQSASGDTVARNRLEFAVNPMPKSILIFCAHEDDDTAHPAIIRAAVENHIPIHFVYWTSGDTGGCDRFYSHSCDAERAMDFGEVRMDEARASLRHMGVPREDLFFLGLPDGGLEQIWDHHVRATNPYLSVLLASDHAPYRDDAIPNLPYARDSVVAAARQFILRFKPETIITGHPDERHVDHRTNNWIVVKAMQQLLREGALSRDTQLVVDQVYGPAPAHRAPYNYEKFAFYVSGEAARIGQEATWYYQSQDGNHQQANLVDFDKLPRHEAYSHFRILDWQEHEGWNEH